MITEQDILDLTDAVSNAVDDWVRAGAGTYEELQARRGASDQANRPA